MQSPITCVLGSVDVVKRAYNQLTSDPNRKTSYITKEELRNASNEMAELLADRLRRHYRSQESFNLSNFLWQ